jgi:predicted SAM-dependent methyltransferase
MGTPLHADEIPEVREPVRPSGATNTAAPPRIVLNLGCGYPLRQRLHSTFREPGWHEIRHDIAADSCPDLVCPIVGLEGIADASVDAIWSSHNLAHLYRHEVPGALNAFCRVLRPGGLLMAAALDLQQIAGFIAADGLDDEIYRSPSGPITPLDMIYGHTGSIGQGSAYMAHRSGFTATTLGQLLVAAGFVDIAIVRTDFELTARASAPTR